MYDKHTYINMYKQMYLNVDKIQFRKKYSLVS